MGFSKQEYWSGLPFPSPGDLSNPGIEAGSPALQTDALPSEPLGKPKSFIKIIKSNIFYALPLIIFKPMARSNLVDLYDRMWSTGEGNGKPLQYSCLENPMNSMKRQNDKILKEELPRSVKVPNMLLEISGEITTERMKGWSQSKNNTQLWM